MIVFFLLAIALMNVVFTITGVVFLKRFEMHNNLLDHVRDRVCDVQDDVVSMQSDIEWLRPAKQKAKKK